VSQLKLESKTSADLGPRLFSYAVIADTHVNHQEQGSNSIYPVNQLHNARLRHVVHEINRQPDLDFVMHLGDLVHPVPAIPDLYVEASRRFKNLIANLRYPVYLVPGNHDVGDKTCAWTPAVCIQSEFIDLYREQFGADYFAFEHKGLHLVQLNVQLLNSGLAEEEKQRLWFESYLDSNRDGRFFLNVHYPVFLTHRNEDSHYDNIDEPGRSWLLDLMERYSIEALFAGHVHQFWYQRYASTDCYYLPSTAFTRQDYSEMARTAPSADMEGGRDDSAKTGYLLVHVHERGHYCQVMRTWGLQAEPGSEQMPFETRPRMLHPLENWRASLGFDMRQDWMESVQVPPSGGPDDFNRKLARNDYSLMALWEMGVRCLRIPKMDLQDSMRLSRLRALREHGQDFVLYTFGIPDPEFVQILVDNPGLISAWEIVFPWHELDATLKAAKLLRDKTGVAIYLAKLRGKDDQGDGGSKFVHAINYGFIPEESEQVNVIAQCDWVDGVVFRVASDALLTESLQAAGQLCTDVNLKGMAILRMSTLSPADFQDNDLWLANRVAEALVVGATLKNLQVIVDTFADIDRGYFRRNGVVDRHYNPRPGFHVVQNLYAAINSVAGDLVVDDVHVSGDIRAIILKRNDQVMILVMPRESGVALNLTVDTGSGYANSIKSVFDLQTGKMNTAIPSVLDGPVLLIG
jgi:predicted phosphodiesterase